VSVEPAFYRDVFAPWGLVTVRKMFGGLGLYRDDIMFGLVANGVLYLRVDEHTKPAFEGAGGRPFMYAYEARSIVMPYWTPPTAVFEDDDEVRAWSDLAFAAALRNRASKASKSAGRSRRN
jgi:DNA transformation protein